MATFTLNDLKQVMESCADALSTDVELAGDVGDVAFTDLGFDSLDVLEIATRIQQDLGIRIPDEAIADMKTPNDVTAYVNERQAA
jgi:act minimal PKS acyl carrier protein